MGVGGAGCSAAYAIAKKFGYQVSGCDKEAGSPYLDEKISEDVFFGHSPNHLKDVEILVYSPAISVYDSDNEEMAYAEKRGLTTISWDRFLANYIVKDKFLIAVAGTHGKSTVTAMIGILLEKGGLDPSCLVGAVVNNWGCNYRFGKSKYFVIEADEYSEKLLQFNPDIAVITNIEFDHPEYFKNFENVTKTFKKFLNNLKKGSFLVTGPGVNLENPKGRTANIVKSEDFELKMIGEFNKVNASIAAIVARELLIDEKKIKSSLESFKGLSRRFEFKGEEKGVLVFDDYAHHPTAIAKTLQAAREKFPDRKIWVVFQPHLFSRTKILFDDFVLSLSNAGVDQIILVDIFAAREKDEGKISSASLAYAIGDKKAKYISDHEEVATYLTKNLSYGDVVITMGAGDIYKLSDRILEKLKGKG